MNGAAGARGAPPLGRPGASRRAPCATLARVAVVSEREHDRPAAARATLTTVVAGALTLGALAASLTLLDSPGYVHGGRVPPRGEGVLEGDVGHYVAWTRLVTVEGLQRAYSGTYPETFAVYGPVVMASYRLAGVAYRGAVDPAFDLQRARESPWLRRALKLVALGWHLAAGGVLLLLLVLGAGGAPRGAPGARRGPGLAQAAGIAALYVASPAALLNVAHWGQPDGAHALFALLAVGLAGAGRGAGGGAWSRLAGRGPRGGGAWSRLAGYAGLAGGALALAALAKPQGWALLPLIGLALWRSGGWGALARGAAGGALAGAVVLLPFILDRRLEDLLRLPGVVAGAMPVVSANAHNLWWLAAAVQGSSPVTVPDSAAFLGPISYRATAALLLGAFLLFVAWLVRSGRAGLAEGAALWTVGWFVLTTQAHENHAFGALPLLALALSERPAGPGLRPVLAVLSVTTLLNLLLQDPLAVQGLGLAGDSPPARRLLADLRTLNAVATVATLLTWSLLSARRPCGRSRGEGQEHQGVHQPVRQPRRGQPTRV